MVTPNVPIPEKNLSRVKTTPIAFDHSASALLHQRIVPDSPISPPRDPRDGFLNKYLVHQGILNSDISIGIDQNTLEISFQPLALIATTPSPLVWQNFIQLHHSHRLKFLFQLYLRNYQIGPWLLLHHPETPREPRL